VKSRSLAARLVEDGHVRINGARADAPAKTVKPGDVLTIALERTVRVLAVTALGARRGPAGEAAALYEDRSPAPPPWRRPAG
jgi:ribosome-associated heat shock protein Hsp15